MPDFTGTKRHNLPPAPELADLVQSGSSLADVGAMFGASARSVQTRLNRGGYTHTGNPQTQAKAAPRPSIPTNPLPRQGEWVLEKACRPQDGDLFYPEGFDKGRQEAEAKSICGRCPVAEQCLAWAMKADKHIAPADRGICGGYTGEERTKLRRKMQKKVGA